MPHPSYSVLYIGHTAETKVLQDFWDTLYRLACSIHQTGTIKLSREQLRLSLPQPPPITATAFAQIRQFLLITILLFSQASFPHPTPATFNSAQFSTVIDLIGPC